MPEDNEEQNPDESYTSKYKKHVVCSYGCKSVYVDDAFSKSFRSYLGESIVFINGMVEESWYCTDIMENILTKNL